MVKPKYFYIIIYQTYTLRYNNSRRDRMRSREWSAFPEVNTAFLELSDCDHSAGDISESTLSLLEHFTVVMYDRTSELSDLNS